MCALQPLAPVRLLALCCAVGLISATDYCAAGQRPDRPDGDQPEPPVRSSSVQVTVTDDNRLSPGEALAVRRETQAISWLADQYATAAELHQFASRRVKSEAVSRYAKHSATLAKQTADRLAQEANRLNQSVASVEKAAGNSPDLSETAGEIGQAVQQRLQARAAERERTEVRAARKPVATEHDDQGEGRRDGRLLDRVGEAREGTARDRLRVVLPEFRRNLPDILALVAEVIEDDGAGEDAQWLEQQRQIADGVLKAKKHELTQYDGVELEQAYLGLALVSNLELRAATQTLAGGADSKLQDVVTDVPQQLAQSMTEARQLMEQPRNPRRSTE